MKKVNIDEIEVSSNLDEVIKSAINERYDNRARRNNKKIRKGLVAATVVATLGSTLFGTNFGNEVIASVRLAMFDIRNYLGVNEDLEDYTTVVNDSISKNGITIQLNEVILDKDEVIVSTTVKSDTKLGETGILVFGDVYVNGRKLSNGAGGSSKLIDEYTEESVEAFHLEKDLPSGDLNIEIKYREALIGGEKEIEVNGPWKFQFKARGDALAINTKEVKMDNSFVLETGQKITLNEYRSNDLGQKIYYSIEEKEKPYDLELKGYDDLGNEVSFYSSHEEKEYGIMKNGSVISNEAKTLRLTLYAVPFPEESGKMSNDFKKVGEEFTIEINR